MDYIIGGNSNNPKEMIDSAIDYFEQLYSKSFEFKGNIEQNNFFGVIGEKTDKSNKNVNLLENGALFKSLYYHKIPAFLESKKADIDYVKEVNNLKNDFIYIKSDPKGIKIFVDRFAHEKVYYTTKAPYLFSTSLKFLIFKLIKKKINYNVLTRFLISGAIIGKETVFSYINRLDVGEYLIINKEGIQTCKYWNDSKNFFLKYTHDNKDISYWIENIYNSLKESVEIPEKKPVLSLMSGGLDSTVITSILLKEFNVPVEALTIVVPNYNEEEGYKASEIAEYLNIPHKICKTELSSIKQLEDSYSEIFRIAEEPMGGTAFLSRYFAFKEIEKSNKTNILTGDGAGEVFSYVRDYILKRFKYINYMYYIPLRIRSIMMHFLQKLYYPTFNLTGSLKNKNNINSLEMLMNSNFLQSETQFHSFFSTWQFSSLEDLYKITGHALDLDTFLNPVKNNVRFYPYKDFNRLGYQFMFTSINSDALISHNLADFFDRKLYCPYISELSFQKLLPIPPNIKMMGDRGKWIVREMAKRKKLLPNHYFDWKPKYGLRQLFFEKESFEIVREYILKLINSLNSIKFVNLKQFERFFRKTNLKRITTHSSEYMKFNIWFGFLGWLSSLNL